MADVQVEALIALGLDPQKAQQGVQSLRDMQRGIDDAKKKADDFQRTLRQVSEAGAKLREVGSVMAGMGAAIIAPFALAANEYVRRFGQLEGTSRNFLKAQERQADATARLGRIAAQALTPALNQVAAISEKIAAFAERHPELVNAALGAGTALVVGGGALAMAGQAVDTLSKGVQLIAPVLPKLASIGVPVAAFVGGLKFGEAAVQAFGKATDNSRLANFQLSDALKTVRQILGAAALGIAAGFVEAKKIVGQAIEGVSDAFKRIGLGIEEFTDRLATTIRQLVARIEGIFADLANGPIGKALGMKAVDRKYTTDQIIQGEEEAYKERSFRRGVAGDKIGKGDSAAAAQYEADKQNLANFARDIANFAETGSLGAGVDNTISNIKRTISGLTSGTGGGANRGGGGPSPEQVNAYIAYRKAAAQADEAYARQVSEAKQNFDREEAKARASFERELADNRKAQERALADAASKYAQDRRNALIKYEQEVSDALKTFQTERARTIRDFNRSEAETTERQNRDRMHRARDFNEQLNDAAANRDVAAYIEAKKAYERQEADTAEQEAADRQIRLDNFQVQLADQQAQFDAQNTQRREQFDRENADAAEQYARERQDILAQYAEKEADMRAAFDREAAERAENYRQQLADMQEAHARERAERERAFLDASKQFAGFIDNIQAKLASAKVQTYGPPVPSHAGGLDYVPYDNYLANLHKGERIVPANQNNQPSVVQNINMTVGDVASGAMVRGELNSLVRSIEQVWRS